jgi:SAM-dependent methyltransferase
MPTVPTDDVAVLNRLVALDGRDAVDIGCGNGWLARAMAARGARVTALEVSESQLAPARAADDQVGDRDPQAGDSDLGSGIVYAIGRGEQTGLADGSQDLVVFMRTLHHVPVPAMGEALAEARRIVRDGGQVYVAEPLPEGDFFTLVSIVEDETEVRSAARAAIREAGPAGLAAAGSERYEIVFELADLDAWIARTTAVEPARAAPAAARRDELARAFADGGEPVPGGGKAFRQAVQVDLLTAV